MATSSNNIDPHVPKMPHKMKDVFAQIYAHERFASLSEGYKVAIDVAERGGSWCAKENNRWIRLIWKWLYLNDPEPV